MGEMLDQANQFSDVTSQISDLRAKFSTFRESLDSGSLDAGLADKFKNLATQIKEFLPEDEQSDVDKFTQKETLMASDLDQLDDSISKISPEKVAENPQKAQEVLQKMSLSFEILEQEVVESIGDDQFREVISENLS